MSKISFVFICVEAVMIGATQVFPQIPHLVAEILFWLGVVGLVITVIRLLLEKYYQQLIIFLQKFSKERPEISILSDEIPSLNFPETFIEYETLIIDNKPIIREKEGRLNITQAIFPRIFYDEDDLVFFILILFDQRIPFHKISHMNTEFEGLSNDESHNIERPKSHYMNVDSNLECISDFIEIRIRKATFYKLRGIKITYLQRK